MTTTESSPATGESKTSRSGDNSHMTLWLILGGASLGGLILTARRRKKYRFVRKAK